MWIKYTNNSHKHSTHTNKKKKNDAKNQNKTKQKSNENVMWFRRFSDCSVLAAQQLALALAVLGVLALA